LIRGQRRAAKSQLLGGTVEKKMKKDATPRGQSGAVGDPKEGSSKGARERAAGDVRSVSIVFSIRTLESKEKRSSMKKRSRERRKKPDWRDNPSMETAPSHNKKKDMADRDQRHVI